MTKKEILSRNRLIAKFMGFNPNDKSFQVVDTDSEFMGYRKGNWDDVDYHLSWDMLMPVVEKIEEIIGHCIEINNNIGISWWYSPKKTGTFSKGAGGGGGETVERTPFESIFGKFYQIHCYYQKGIKFKRKKEEIAENKIEAVYISCCRWIKWYNETVLNKNKDANKRTKKTASKGKR